MSRLSNLCTFPQPIPELSLHAVLSCTPEDGGYAITLDCGHTVWHAIDPGKQSYCGACASKFIDQLRAARQS